MANFLAIFKQKLELRVRCKEVHFVDFGESFPTQIYLQKSESIQPRTSPVKFARSPCTDPPGGADDADPLVKEQETETNEETEKERPHDSACLLECIDAINDICKPILSNPEEFTFVIIHI